MMEVPQKKECMRLISFYRNKLVDAASKGEWFEVRQIDHSLSALVGKLNAYQGRQHLDLDSALKELSRTYSNIIQLAYREQEQLKEKLCWLQQSAEGVKAYSENLIGNS